MKEAACRERQSGRFAQRTTMNLDFYRNYIKIIDCGTLSGAARELHIAQSALSSQVKSLEEEYGTELFLRGNRRLELTETGKLLYEKAKSIVTLVDASHKEIDAHEAGARGTVRIGMTQAYPDVNITGLLLQFQKENPQIRYEFYEVNSGEVMDLLRNGVVEIGIVRTSGVLPPDLNEALELKQRLCAFCCYNNPWITPYGRDVALSSLRDVPLALSRGFADLVEEIFARADMRANVMSVSTSRSNPVMWAKAGAAVAIICAGEADNTDDAESFCRPLSSEDPVIAQKLKATRSFITVRGRTLSAAAQHFLNFSQAYLQ